MPQTSGYVLPFSGLGFDLSPVAARAQLFAVHYGPVSQVAPARQAVPVRQLSGYELQLNLNREIRGR